MKKTLLISLIVISLFSFKQSYSQADAGPDQEICTNFTYMAAVDPAPNTGQWIVLTGTGTVENPTLYNSLVTNISLGMNMYRWEVTIGIDVYSDEMTITNNNFSVDAGPDQNICTNFTQMNADDPLTGTGVWTLIAGLGVFHNSSDFNAGVTDISPGCNVYRWTITRNGCTNSDFITICDNSPSTAIITGPLVTETCDGTVTLTANMPVPYYADNQYWQGVSGGATFIDPSTSFTMNVTNLQPGNNIFSWSVLKAGCAPSVDNITITNNEVTAEAGTNQIICANNTFLNATNTSVIYPFQGTGSWSNLSGNGAVIENILAPNSAVTNIPPGTTALQWTVELGSCSSSDLVMITNSSVHATATDAQTCNTSITNLSGNIPGPGESGIWDCFTVGVTYDNQSLYNTGAHNLVEGVNNFVWTISNGFCSNAAFITVNYINPIAVAGAPQDLCENFTFLEAMNPTPGTGVWSVFSGSGTFTNPTFFGTYVSGIQKGVNTYRWTVTDRGCMKTSDVTISNNLPTVGAGSDQITCNNSVILSGTNPLVGETGIWTQTAGIAASITNDALFNSTVTGLSTGVSIFEWTISNALCSASDQVTITYNQVIADAGADQTTCDGTAVLAALNPSPGTGYWEALGTGTILNVSDFNTTVTGLALGANTFRWHQSFAGCSNYDDVVVTNNYVSVSAGMDQSICLNNTILVGNNPPTGSGIWTRTVGSGTVITPSFYNSAVFGISAGINIFRWTITRGLCINYDEVVITNNQITNINAGVNQNVCTTSATLAALAPQIGESGFWTVAGGSAVPINSAFYTTGVTGLVPGDNLLVWNLTNGICSATDTVIVRNNSPTVALVPPDAEICSSIYNLVGNLPNIGESGLWTNEFGATGVILNPSNNITIVQSLGVGSNTFRWTISNALCNSFDEIVITNNTFTTDAGLDASVCGDTIILAADNPAPGTGIWTVVNPVGIPSFDNATAYNTIVRNLASGSNIFKWTATINGCSAWDIVTILNNSPSTAVAGPDETVCTDYFELPTINDGVWTYLSGCGSITENTTTNVWEVDLCLGENELELTVTNGECSASDIVIITNNSIYADAGDDQTICTSYTQLAAEVPVAGTGVWSITSGSGVISSPSYYATTVTGLSPGLTVLNWTVTNVTCLNSDNVIITYNLPPIAQFETDPTVFCAPEFVSINNTSTQYGGQSPPDEFQWLIEDLAVPTTYDVNTDVTHYFTNTAQWDSIYHIRLIAVDYQTMCRDTFISEVTALAAPLTGFTVMPDVPLSLPNAVFIIQNISATDLVSYEWDFGNGDNRYDNVFVPNFDYEYTVAGTYIITLEATNNDLCHNSYSDTVVVLPYTSVEDINSNFKVYPNPTDGLITISSSENMSDAFIEIKNVAGQNVPFNILSNTADAFTIDLSNLSKGMYFLKIVVGEQTRILRLVKK